MEWGKSEKKGKEAEETGISEAVSSKDLVEKAQSFIDGERLLAGLSTEVDDPSKQPVVGTASEIASVRVSDNSDELRMAKTKRKPGEDKGRRSKVKSEMATSQTVKSDSLESDESKESISKPTRDPDETPSRDPNEIEISLLSQTKEAEEDPSLQTVAVEMPSVPDYELKQGGEVPTGSDQIDYKTGKIKKSKKKRPSVKEVFSSFEEPEPVELLSPVMEREEVTESALKKESPSKSEAISPDREVKSGRSKRRGKEKKIVESRDYKVETETSVQDDKPKVELSVKVDERGVQVLEVFTTGGMQEEELQKPVESLQRDDDPLQVPKSGRIQLKKKSKKKSSHVEIAPEEKGGNVIEKSLVTDRPPETSKSPGSILEDDISRRTIMKAKRKLPAKPEERVTKSYSPDVETTSAMISAESSVPVTASFPEELEREERTQEDSGAKEPPSNESKLPEAIMMQKKSKKKGQGKGEKKYTDPLVKISTTLSSDVMESSSNVKYVLPKEDTSSVSLAIQHVEDVVNVSVVTGANEPEIVKMPGDTVTRVNVTIARSPSPQTTSSEFLDSERKLHSPSTEEEPWVEKDSELEQLIPDEMERVSDIMESLKTRPPAHRMILGDLAEDYDIDTINNNLNKMKEASTEEEVRLTVVSTVLTITEYLEIITYRIYSTERTTLMTDEEKLVKLEKLKTELLKLREATEKCGEAPGCGDDVRRAVEALSKAVDNGSSNAASVQARLQTSVATSEEYLNRVNNVTVLLDTLNHDIASLHTDPNTSTTDKLERVYAMEEENEERLRDAAELRRMGGGTEEAVEMGLRNRGLLSEAREALERDLSLALEYRDTLAELEQVTAMANTLVNTRPVVTSLQHLQAELQKDRKFFANLTRCRALLESLERNLDEETRLRHTHLHRDLHRRAAQILERASLRAEAMAQTASKWMLLEGRLKEEKAWLTVAAQRVPGLAGVTSSDYEQFISLYQTLSMDIGQHSGCIWRWLCIAHSLQDLVTCRPLEDSCEHLREVISDLETRVSSDLARLTAFRHVWTRYESLRDRVDHWLDQVERNDRLHQPTTNIVNFWELKAEYEVYKEIGNEAGLEFETAVRTLPIADERSERSARSEAARRWARLEAVLVSLHQSVESGGGSCSERLDTAESRLTAVRELLDRLGYITPPDAQQLSLHTEQLQVVKGSVERIGTELGELGPVPCELADRVGRLQTTARSLQATAFKLLTHHRDTEARLGKVGKALAKLNLHHAKAASVLEHAAKAEDGDYDHLGQASDKTENVVSRLKEDRKLLEKVEEWVREMGSRCPGLADSLRGELSKLRGTQEGLESLAGDTLGRLSAQLHLWRSYIDKRNGLETCLRQANYMMDLLTIRGRVDYQHLLKTTDRLHGVAETLGKVEGSEVWGAAEELKPRLRLSEAQALETEVESLQAELASTSRQLEAMCSRYRKAAQLWAQATALQQHLASTLQRTVAALHHPVPTLAQALPIVTDEEKAKLKELEELAEGIADEMGVERELVLGRQVDCLGQRLKDVESTLHQLSEIQALADPPPPPPSIPEVVESRGDEKGESVNRVVELRSHLLNMGGHNQQPYQTSPLPPSLPTDQTLTHKLQLWEELFRSTFEEYHRVSCRLASTGEANTLLKLWKDYLDQVNCFLTSPLPDEYQSLTYHTSLCQAHENVLGSQQAILEKKRSSPGRVEREWSDELRVLSELHNDTLARMTERQREAAQRIQAWETYRTHKNSLLLWLRHMETSRNKLNLRYLRIKAVPTTLHDIQDLLNKIVEGENDEKRLKDFLKVILSFTEDESLAKSLRLDQATIAQRIANMAAALQTWKGHMMRVNEYIDSFESQTDKLSSTLSEIRDRLPPLHEPNLSRSQIQQNICLLKELRSKLDESDDSLKSIDETEERLKEYISPVDAKSVCQRVWILRQQRLELERSVELLLQQMEERLELSHIYHTREKKFLEWAESVERRLEGGGEAVGRMCGEAEEEVRRLEAEVATRKAEVEWLVTNGELLRSLDTSSKESRPSGAVQQAWARLHQLTSRRSNNLRALIQSTRTLELKFEELGCWLESMEAKLALPYVIKNWNEDELTQLMKQQENLTEEIQKQSQNVTEVLNTCEIILNDCGTCHVSLETRGIASAKENIEARWKGVCVNSAKLKEKLKSVWGLVHELMKLHEKQEPWLKQLNNRFRKLEHRAASCCHADLPTLVQSLQKVESEVTGGSQGLSLVEELYSRVAGSGCVDPKVTQPLSDLLTLWYRLKRDVSDLASDVQATVEKVDRFEEAQSECVVGLSAVDALLAIAEAGGGGSAEVERAGAEVARLSSAVSRADTAAALLMESSNRRDRARVEASVQEYKTLWSNVQSRIERLSIQRVRRSNLENAPKTEVDASTQVNTLDSSTPGGGVGSITRREAYQAELQSTLAQLSDLLDRLESTKHTSSLQLNKMVGGCQSTLELARHLSRSLMKECGSTAEEAGADSVSELERRFQHLQSRCRARGDQLTSSSAGARLSCPLCSSKNWKQFDNDIWRLEQWLQHAHSFFHSQPKVLPTSIELLEDIIQDHREITLDLESHHQLVLSLNIIGNHLAEHSDNEERADELRERLSTANRRWEEVCHTAASWHTRLHQALMQNDEFHENMVSLVDWLERTETAIKESEPVDLTDPIPLIRAKYNKFRELKGEVERCEPRVKCLEEAATEVLTGEENRSTVERLRGIALRLRSLSSLVSVYLLKLGAVLGDDPLDLLPTSHPSLDSLSHQLLDNAVAAPSTQELNDGVDTGALVRSCRLLGRVVRASVPISAVLLLVLGATTLVPLTQEDYSCTLANTLLTSFTPVLRYPYGRPPV